MPTQEEQLVVAGEEAEVLLKNPAFNTGPEDAEKREYSYSHYRAIVDVVDTLKQRVQVSQSILEQQNGDNRQEETAP